MKITGQVQEIFGHAVALDQNGGLRNTIYADHREIFVLNYDHTVLLRFRLRGHEESFPQPISFRANDYDSDDFTEENGQIIFRTEQNGYVRKKSCGRAEYTPGEIKTMFTNYLHDADNGEEVILTASVLGLLDNELSHIEFSGKKGSSMVMIQRNIYSGGTVEVREADTGFFHTELANDFGPVGMKTSDFWSLFAFQDKLKFRFPTRDKEDYIVVRSYESDKRDMLGVVACCLYDEIIKIKEVQNGR